MQRSRLGRHSRKGTARTALTPRRGFPVKHRDLLQWPWALGPGLQKLCRRFFNRGVQPVASGLPATENGYECSPTQNCELKHYEIFLGVVTCHNVFNPWPETNLLLPVWPRGAKGWTPARRTSCLQQHTPRKLSSLQFSPFCIRVPHGSIPAAEPGTQVPGVAIRKAVKWILGFLGQEGKTRETTEIPRGY